MSVKYIQTGDAVDYTPGADVGAGDVVVANHLIVLHGVAHEIVMGSEDDAGTLERKDAARLDVPSVGADHHAELQPLLLKHGKLPPRDEVPHHRHRFAVMPEHFSPFDHSHRVV